MTHRGTPQALRIPVWLSADPRRLPSVRKPSASQCRQAGHGRRPEELNGWLAIPKMAITGLPMRPNATAACEEYKPDHK